MRFTDIFIRRPVLASVISLLMIAFGIMAIRQLPLRQFPDVNLSVININSSFPGTTPEAMQTMVTNYLQDAVAGIDNIDYLFASSSAGGSSLTVHLLPGTNVDTAIAQITAKIQQTKSNLPTDPTFENPIIQSASADNSTLMYIAFYSKEMNTEQVSDYINRVVATQLDAVDGVANASVMGGRTYAMRIWLDPKLMTAKNVTIAEVQTALTSSNVIGGAGYIEGKNDLVNIEAQTGLSSPQEFNNIVVRKGTDGSTLVRIKDIGYAELGATSYSSAVLANGQSAVLVRIDLKAAANPLTVAKSLKQLLPSLQAHLPLGMQSEMIYDKSRFIEESVNSVIETMIEAALIVIAVILLSLGSLRAAIIPMITIPLCLIGVCAIMMLLHFSLNVLTLLAMVLAIGLVVDDAIVVSENITRHLEEGMTPLNAALQGAREIAAPVITMTLTVAAVFLPVGLAGGLTGTLFSEFAYTLAGAVLLSGLISLTLSPMMCSKVMSQKQLQQPLVMKVDHFFERLKNNYERILTSLLMIRPVIIFAAIAIIFSCVVLYSTTSQELAPAEDQGVIMAQTQAPNYANFQFTNHYMQQMAPLLHHPSIQNQAIVINRNNGQLIILLKPRDERKENAADIESHIMPQLKQIPGLMTIAQDPPTLPGGGAGAALEFDILSPTNNPTLLYQLSQVLQERANASGLFKDVDIGMKLDTPIWEVSVDQAKAAQMGISNQAIMSTLNGVLGGGHINYFRMSGRNYQVIPQAMNEDRMTPDILKTLSVQTDSGVMVPLANFITLDRVVKATSLLQFQRLNSTSITASMAAGHSLSEGIDFMKNTANSVLPPGMSYDFGLQARQMLQEGNRVFVMFVFALVIIFLVLAAQFESFRAPLIVMMTVPMSLFGALIPLNLGFGTINLFTQIGFLTLIGLISKHGILIVQFANSLQAQGLSIREAVVKAATLRLRPILMTTAAMMFGVVPLIFNHQGLANSQRDIALVIFFGMLIGTCFTLFVVPAIYTLLAQPKKL